MRIACPRCEESYRIEPARLPAARVRTACLACGEPLFLRRAGNGRVSPTTAATAESALAPVDEVPIWSEPRRPDVQAATADAVEVSPEREPTLAPFVPDLPPVGSEVRPLEPYVADVPAETAPFAPEPAEPEPAAAELPPAPELDEAALPPAAARAEPAWGAGDQDVEAAGIEPRVDPARPLEAFVPGPSVPVPPRPLEPFLTPGAEEPTRKGAFTFSQVGDVSARAQRLARALVSDILVYHPKKVEQGLREGNLRDAMKEEVEKSWDEYCERLGPDVARSNRTAFVNALNEILARGKSVF